MISFSDKIKIKEWDTYDGYPTLFFKKPASLYEAWIASVGQASPHDPQSVHISGSIL